MANYATLKAAIEAVIRTNGNEEITGAVLQQSLLAMINSLGADYQYAGVATPSTAPGTPDQNVFYITTTPGTYQNFGGLSVDENEVAILKYNGEWIKEVTGCVSTSIVDELGAVAAVTGLSIDKKFNLEWTDGECVTTNGQILGMSSGVYASRRYIPVKQGQRLYLNVHAPGVTDVCAWYDTDYNFLSSFTASQTYVTAPQDGFLRVSNESAVVASPYVQLVTSDFLSSEELRELNMDAPVYDQQIAETYDFDLDLDWETGATLGGLEVSDTSYIIVGSSIVQGSSTSGNKNIFVSTVNKTTGDTATKWLTSDASSKGSYSNPYIVKVSDTKFCVIWSRSSTLYYAFIDGSGNIQGSVYTASGSLSDCQPVLSGNKIIWFTKGSSTDFAFIDLTDNSFNRAFTVTVESSKHGTATVSPTKALTGKQITVNIKPDDGYELDVIRVNGNPIEGNKFEMPGKNTTVSVFFKKIGSPSIGETVPVGDLNCLVTNSDTDGAGTVAVTSAATQAEAIVIPNTVEINGSFYKVNKIAARAFFENTTIKTVYIGANVTVIDTNAFFGCPNLVKVSGGAGLKVIGQNAFARCPKLSTFIITSKVLYKIGPQAFYKDSRLKTVYVKNTTKLTKSGVKKSLKGSKVKTVKVKVGSKKENKKYVKKYKKFFTKKNAGKKAKVRR